ncbi:icc protein [Acinetobacter genomosp. 15BJ]|uniref:Icc protein n=1 Tax=Acinetobacter genomosp. 15BJ TaxID=106651 RepID=R9ALV4_9GAMM|nr:icc protein [Acinetobacter genomosp. 15BJ]
MTFQVSSLSQQDFVMIQITDTHLLEYPHLEFVGMQPEQSFHAVIDLMRQQHPHIDLIVHTGDLAQSPTPLTYKGVVSGNGKYSTLRIFTPTSFNDIQHGIFA